MDRRVSAFVRTTLAGLGIAASLSLALPAAQGSSKVHVASIDPNTDKNWPPGYFASIDPNTDKNWPPGYFASIDPNTDKNWPPGYSAIG